MKKFNIEFRVLGNAAIFKTKIIAPDSETAKYEVTKYMDPHIIKHIQWITLEEQK